MTNRSKTRIALIQMRSGPEPEKNFSRAIKFIRDAAAKGAQIVCLPELFRSQYFCQTEDHKNFDLAEEIPGKSTSALGEVARETGAVIIASLFEQRSAGLYHKKFYFAPGDLGFQAWPTTRGKIGVCVCWDQWYPEAARLTALHGAEIIFYPTAIGWHPSEKKEFGAAQHAAWETIQRSHAIANGCYVAVPNRVGHEAPAGGDGIEFWGQSFVCGPDGEIIAKGSVDGEEIVAAEIDWKRVNEHRTHWPFLRDRRIDAYTGLQERLID